MVCNDFFIFLDGYPESGQYLPENCPRVIVPTGIVENCTEDTAFQFRFICVSLKISIHLFNPVSMPFHTLRKTALLLSCLCFVGLGPIGIPHLNHTLKELDNTAVLRHATWGAYAVYADNGQVLMDHNSERGLAPASGLKAVTTSIALNELGPDFRFKTSLFYDGNIGDDGILHGNIYIKGGGDPTLGSDEVKGSLPLDALMQQWVKAIKAVGIKKIDGPVIADNQIFSGNSTPDYWLWMDIGNYYGAGANGLTIHDDLYTLYFHPSRVVGRPARLLRMDPRIPGLTFINDMKTGAVGSGDNGYIYAGPLQKVIVLRGTVPAGYTEFSDKGSIPDPALFAADTLRSSLKSAGIAVSDSSRKATGPVAYSAMHEITTTLSPKLSDIVYKTNKKSINLYAEHCLRMLAVHETGKGTEVEGVKTIRRFLKDHHIYSEGMHIYDGSGLSPADRITPRTMVEQLVYASKQSWFPDFYRSLGIAGDPDDIGYFNHFGNGTPIANNARIKSGLISDARSMSGYLHDKKGRLIVFSMIANNYDGHKSDVDHLYKKVLIELADLH